MYGCGLVWWLAETFLMCNISRMALFSSWSLSASLCWSIINPVMEQTRKRLKTPKHSPWIILVWKSLEWLRALAAVFADLCRTPGAVRTGCTSYVWSWGMFCLTNTPAGPVLSHRAAWLWTNSYNQTNHHQRLQVFSLYHLWKFLDVWKWQNYHIIGHFITTNHPSEIPSN